MEPTPDSRNKERSYASELDAYDALCCYTLSLRDAEFLHQYAVDAWAVQHASAHTKCIALNFAMFGLYCGVEKSISGRQVQIFHVHMGRTRRIWPSLPLPRGTSSIAALDVMRAPPGSERNAMIRNWAATVWACCADARPQVVELARIECGITP